MKMIKALVLVSLLAGCAGRHAPQRASQMDEEKAGRVYFEKKARLEQLESTKTHDPKKASAVAKEKAALEAELANYWK